MGITLFSYYRLSLLSLGSFPQHQAVVRTEAGLAVWVTPVSSALPQLNILACGVVGSYSVVLAVDSYVSTSLSYITLNVLRRALNTGFRGAFIRVPFQTNGKILESRNQSDVRIGAPTTNPPYQEHAGITWG